MAQSFYAVGRGRQVGVYTTWADCLQQVENISNAKFRKFKTRQEAVAFIEECKAKYSPVKNPSTNPLPSNSVTLPSFSVSQPSVSLSANHTSVASTDQLPCTQPLKVQNSRHFRTRPPSELIPSSQRLDSTSVVAPVSVPCEKSASKTTSSEIFSPQTIAAIQSLTQVFLPEVPTAESQNSTSTMPFNSNDVVDINKLSEKIDNGFSEIKNTLARMMLKIGDLDTKVERLSSQVKVDMQGQTVNAPRSSVKRALLEGYDVPQPVGSRNFSTNNSDSEVEIVPVPPKKIPKVELNSDDEADGSSHNFKVGEDGYVIVYTDGACEKNGKKGAKAGIGVWFGDGHPLNCSEPVHGRPTNNTAEIQAAVQAVEIAKRAGVKRIHVHTDSEFTINCITKWIHKWKRNDWKVASGADVKNKEDLILLHDAMKGIDVKWQHVRGHRGIHGNEMADCLARSGAERYKP